jgi:hypothetical protein
MPVSLAPVVQSLFVLSLPVVLAMAPSEGAVRTVALRHIRLSEIVNAVVATDGRILAARPDGELLVTGRRDRIARALLPLGVFILPARAAGCSIGKEG